MSKKKGSLHLRGIHFLNNLIDLHYSNHNNSEDFWFYLNNVAICFQKYNFANPTGQWSLRVPLPLRFQDKNSFLSFVNSNAPDGKSLYAENYSDSTINVSDLGGVTEGIVHILTIGKVKWFYFLNNLVEDYGNLQKKDLNLLREDRFIVYGYWSGEKPLNSPKECGLYGVIIQFNATYRTPQLIFDNNGMYYRIKSGEFGPWIRLAIV